LRVELLLKMVDGGVCCDRYRTHNRCWGSPMKKLMLAAALLAVAFAQGVSAADKRCYSAADIEAEQAILFQTNLMVISSACRDTVYAEFRLRNKDAIIRYQKAMIDHFRRAGSRNAQSEFDRWNTSLANEISLKQSDLPTAVVCQQAAEMLKMASALDAKGLRDYALAKATSTDNSHPKCSK
jgi:hypothetical protein